MAVAFLSVDHDDFHIEVFQDLDLIFAPFFHHLPQRDLKWTASMADSGLGPIPPADPAMLPHNSHKVGIIVAEVVGVVIATLFVALRVYTRTKIVKVFALTDWFLLAALVC